jgi:hypothetical protein
MTIANPALSAGGDQTVKANRPLGRKIRYASAPRGGLRGDIPGTGRLIEHPYPGTDSGRIEQRIDGLRGEIAEGRVIGGDDRFPPGTLESAKRRGVARG